jgi:hypothetical protein
MHDTRIDCAKWLLDVFQLGTFKNSTSRNRCYHIRSLVALAARYA